MATTKDAENFSAGRQAAYTARNRAALLKAGQEVLAEIGPGATIEQLATHAQVSPTTIYKYFSSKEVLFAEGLDHLWREWVVWSYNGAPPASSLEAVMDSARKLFWLNETHPLFAKILRNMLSNPGFLIAAVKGGGTAAFQELAKQGVIPDQNFEERIILWSYCLAGLLTAVYVNEELTPQEAEVAMGIGLSIWGISEAKAKKLMSRTLVFAPLK